MKYKTISMKQFFPAKGAIYYVAIATVIFSRVKITCYFHVWRYHAFARKLIWYFIGAYVIKMFLLKVKKNNFFCLLKLDSLIKKFTSIYNTACNKLMMHCTYEATILQHHQIQSSKGAREVLLWFCKAPPEWWNSFATFFFFLTAAQEYFFYYICAACNFFLLTSACRKFFF